jgi:hypothetical protein
VCSWASLRNSSLLVRSWSLEVSIQQTSVTGINYEFNVAQPKTRFNAKKVVQFELVDAVGTWARPLCLARRLVLDCWLVSV